MLGWIKGVWMCCGLRWINLGLGGSGCGKLRGLDGGVDGGQEGGGEKRLYNKKPPVIKTDSFYG